MSVAYTVYVNGYWFDTLYDAETYGDRPEPYRLHERTLWTLYQVVKAGGNRATIVDANQKTVAELASPQEVSEWVGIVYPRFLTQLSQPVFTQFAHPLDKFPPPG